MKIFTSAHISEKHFNTMLELSEKNNPIFFEFDLKKLSDELIDKHRLVFPWHFKDSVRSITNSNIKNLTPYEFSYSNRFIKHFGINQIELCKSNLKNIVLTWDPKIDLFNFPRPCLLAIKFIKDGKFLHLSVVFRNRDLLKRLIPNWYCCYIILNNISKDLSLKTGKLFDYSIQSMYNDNDYQKWKNVNKIK